MIKPLLIAAIVVSLLGVANREFVIPIPHVRDELTRDTKDLGGNQTRDLEPRFDGRTDILIGGEKTVAAEQRIIKPTFVLPATLDHATASSSSRKTRIAKGPRPSIRAATCSRA